MVGTSMRTRRRAPQTAVSLLTAWCLLVGDGLAQEPPSRLPPPPGFPIRPAQELADMRALAEAGDAEAQNNLGLMYFNGRGVAQDDAEAVAWYRRAAEQGFANAQYNLGALVR